MNFNADIAVVRARGAGEPRRLRLGPLHQRHPGRSRGLVRHPDRLHPAPPWVGFSARWPPRAWLVRLSLLLDADRVPSRSRRWSPTRSALAIAVSAGFTALEDGKKLVSTT